MAETYPAGLGLTAQAHDATDAEGLGDRDELQIVILHHLRANNLMTQGDDDDDDDDDDDA